MFSPEENRESFLNKFDEYFNRQSVQERCTPETITNLYRAFLKTPNKAMSKSEIKEAFEQILKIYLQDEEFNILFNKLDSRRDNFVTWDEFISYLLLEFQGKDVSLQWQILELPISTVPQLIKKTHHRMPISKIVFCPEVTIDRTWSFLHGYYITASKDGVMNYWSLDFKHKRNVQSTNPFLKVRPTVVTDIIAMPDIQIICTSSCERDLRFYDTAADKFDLRVMITNFEDAVCCMSYYFSQNIKEHSYIILGDTRGSVKIMAFNSADKAHPFKEFPERELTQLSYDAVSRGELNGLTLKDFKKIHLNWVHQVDFYQSLGAFISCSRCSKFSVILCDPTGTKFRYQFDIHLGVSCFTFCEDNQILVTGGPDCLIRTWNPFVPKKALNIFHGHQSPISAVFTQNSGRRIYSLAKDKCIKVWDVFSHTCIQTYNGLPNELSEYTTMSVVYNSFSHKMIIAAVAIAVVTCEEVINEQYSDGFTHTKSVTNVLYNHLFKEIVTTDLDSNIIVWDPWLGRRLFLVKLAHSKLLHGENFPIEITAATFDISEHFLLTGARDGSLKMWNFHTGSCLKNMAIEDQCEITSVVWLKHRILCTGWNRHVTEFADTDFGVHKKSWETRHSDDIVAASLRHPQALATASYNGEIILWRLETGQPYRRYQVNNPTGRYNIAYKDETKSRSSSDTALNIRKVSYSNPTTDKSVQSINFPEQKSMLTAKGFAAVQTIFFLTNRPMDPSIGSFLVSLDSGTIQVWTHHPAAGFLTSFSAIHRKGDCAMSLTSDLDNEFLLTGHKYGYIKVWLLSNYALPNPPKICMPLLRLEFPFLWKDRILGRAKRAVRNQPLPILLSSHRGHLKCVNSLQFVPGARIIISGSSDRTVRLWTLGGRYLSILGTFKPWNSIIPSEPVVRYYTDFRLPPDIKRVGSFTTMKILQGGTLEIKREDKSEDQLDLSKEITKSDRDLLYGEELSSPILGHYETSGGSLVAEELPILENSFSHIPVYTHLRLKDLEEIPSSRYQLLARN